MRRRTKKMLIAIPLTVAAGLFVVYLALPWPVVYRWQDPSTTSFTRYRVSQAERRGETLEIRQEWVPLEGIAEPMRRAVVLAEDGRFREHRGIDWRAVGEELRYDDDGDFAWTDPRDLRAVGGAVLYYWRNRSSVRGRSTITQQLAKNLYFTPERSLARKAAELVVARRLERILDKDRILELYLNTVELGPGLFGVGAAARRYFGRSAAELTSYQAASLAATLPHPLTSNPETDPGRMARRRDVILRRMGGGGPEAGRVPEPPTPVPAPEIEPPEDVDRPAMAIDSPAAPAPASGAAGDDTLVPPDPVRPSADSVPPPPAPPGDTVAAAGGTVLAPTPQGRRHAFRRPEVP